VIVARSEELRLETFAAVGMRAGEPLDLGSHPLAAAR
jgi:hypothetical protein